LVIRPSSCSSFKIFRSMASRRAGKFALRQAGREAAVETKSQTRLLAGEVPWRKIIARSAQKRALRDPHYVTSP
jgi:hypothetical protein